MPRLSPRVGSSGNSRDGATVERFIRSGVIEFCQLLPMQAYRGPKRSLVRHKLGVRSGQTCSGLLPRYIRLVATHPATYGLRLAGDDQGANTQGGTSRREASGSDETEILLLWTPVSGTPPSNLGFTPTVVRACFRCGSALATRPHWIDGCPHQSGLATSLARETLAGIL
jgi:hypothetical protein